jgi:hypothetical protein
MNATKRRNWTLWERRREGTGLWERENGHRFRDITSDITSVASLDSTSDVMYHFCVATEAKRRNWGPEENLKGLLDDPSGQQSEGPVHWKGLPPVVPILAERAPYVVRVAVIAHFRPAVAIIRAGSERDQSEIRAKSERYQGGELRSSFDLVQTAPGHPH